MALYRYAPCHRARAHRQSPLCALWYLLTQNNSYMCTIAPPPHTHTHTHVHIHMHALDFTYWAGGCRDSDWGDKPFVFQHNLWLCVLFGLLTQAAVLIVTDADAAPPATPTPPAVLLLLYGDRCLMPTVERCCASSRDTSVRFTLHALPQTWCTC